MPSFASTDGPKSDIPIKNHRYQIVRWPWTEKNEKGQDVPVPMPVGQEPVAGTGMLVPWTRTSTILDTHEDKEGIFKWTKRLVVKGIGAREDLYALAAATRLEDKAGLLKIADQAFDYAKGQAASNLGTALHGFLERWVEGDKDLVVPSQWKGDVGAVMAAFQAANIRLRPDLQEVCVVRPDLKDGDAGGLAGRLDLVVEMLNPETGEWELILADYKTGSDPLLYGSWKIQQQLGLYGTAWAIWDGTHWRPMPKIRRDKILMVHVLPGQASAQIHIGDVDPVALEEDLAAAYRTRRRRKEAKKAWRPLVTVEDGNVLESPEVDGVMPTEDALQQSAGMLDAPALGIDLHQITSEQIVTAVRSDPGFPVGPTKPPVGPRACPTCSFPTRETVNLVCQTCGWDYSRGEKPLDDGEYKPTKPTPLDRSDAVEVRDREEAERAAATVARVAAESNPNLDDDETLPEEYGWPIRRPVETPAMVPDGLTKGELAVLDVDGTGQPLAPLTGPGERGCGVCGRKGHRRNSPKCLGEADPIVGRLTTGTPRPDPERNLASEMAANGGPTDEEIADGAEPAWCRCSTRTAGWTAPADGEGPWVCGDCGLPSKLGVPLAVRTGEQATDPTKLARNLLVKARAELEHGHLTVGGQAILSGDPAEILSAWEPHSEDEPDERGTAEELLAAALLAGEMVRTDRKTAAEDNRAHGVFNESDAATMAAEEPDPFDEDGSDAFSGPPVYTWLDKIALAKDKAELRAIRADAMKVGEWTQELTAAGLERIRILGQQG